MKVSDTMNIIFRLFEDLSGMAKIETMSVLYYDMSDFCKDMFLKSINNE